MASTREKRIMDYYNAIKNGKYENKSIAKIYLSNLKALAMEFEGYEKIVEEASEIVTS